MLPPEKTASVPSLPEEQCGSIFKYTTNTNITATITITTITIAKITSTTNTAITIASIISTTNAHIRIIPHTSIIIIPRTASIIWGPCPCLSASARANVIFRNICGHLIVLSEKKGQRSVSS